ncbi:hypothetical protein JVU11DRAFT_2676 [Chiua virens]|nr:hypothetical protein JVU11DRAFT_2676 [Chiua virens]
MQACRVLRNSVATPSVNTPARLPYTVFVRSKSFAVDYDHGRSLTNVAPVGSNWQSPTQARTSELLQKAVSLLPRSLSTEDGAVGPDSSFFWSNVLERSIAELISGSDQVPSMASIVVCGLDKWPCSQDLVTALLEDPFSSDPTYSDILRNRWKNTPSSVNIQYGKPAAFAEELFSPSDWLQRFSHPIQLTELPDLASLASINEETDSLLLHSDVLLLLCDPIVTPLSDLAARAKHLLDKPNTILILTSSSAAESHRQFVSQTLSRFGCRPGHILFVDPRQALGAVTALQANPTSPSTVDRYQRDTLASRISTVTSAIDAVLSPRKTSETSILDIRQRTAYTQVHGALSASFRLVESAEKDVALVATKIEALLSKVQRIQESTRHDILGKPGTDSKVEKALSQSMKELNAVLGSLTFLKMVWRVDEIGTLVSAAVQGQWCKGLENQLILHTGRLESTQRELSTFTSGLISAASSSSLRSPVLENQLQQLEHSPTHALTVTSLTRPIQDRRSQLIQYTTAKLHREAQGAVVATFGGLLSGAGLGWWLAFGEHILSLGAGTEIGTAIGSGVLLAVGGIRWAVGKWERAKQRWLQDAGRIGEGLTRDLQACSTVQRIVDDNVTIVASTACKGVQDLVDRRHDEISQLQGELLNLDTELNTCAEFSGSRKSTHSVKNVDIEQNR